MFGWFVDVNVLFFLENVCGGGVGAWLGVLFMGVWRYGRVGVWFVYLRVFFNLSNMKSSIRNYRDLEVWQEAMNLAEAVYHLTELMPKEELYGLTSQIRRASVSIPSNIAEGHGRKGKNEFMHHLSIARGSLCELETQLVLSARVKFFSREDLKPVWSKTQTVGRLLSGLVRSLR
jgi:four helix bundle protein